MNKQDNKPISPNKWILKATPMELHIAKILGKRIDSPTMEAYEYKGCIYIMDWTK